jgi:hypothetical protein
MAHYPQLLTDTVCQFPTNRRATTRTVLNELTGGVNIRMGDPGGAAIRWVLKYSGLTDDELGSLRELFDAMEGRLNTFTFLDPTANLLEWSDDWTKSVWGRDSLLTATTGVADPFGGMHASEITNTGEAAQRASQSIDGAGTYQYCFSLYLRSDAASAARLFLNSGGQELDLVVTSGASWTRATMTGKLTSSADTVSFGVELMPGIRVQVFGAQVEAQPGAGQYKGTTDRAGVYTLTRFDADSFTVIADAPNQQSCSVTLISN